MTRPVNVRVGGFYRVPSARELAPLAEQLRRALDLALDTAAWVAAVDFSDFRCEHELLALREPGRYFSAGCSLMRIALSVFRTAHPRRTLFMPASTTRCRAIFRSWRSA